MNINLRCEAYQLARVAQEILKRYIFITICTIFIKFGTKVDISILIYRSPKLALKFDVFKNI